MDITNFFNNLKGDNIRKAAGLSLIATGISLTAFDAFRLANGDASVVLGPNFAANAGLITSGAAMFTPEIVQTGQPQGQPVVLLVQDKN